MTHEPGDQLAESGSAFSRFDARVGLFVAWDQRLPEAISLVLPSGDIATLNQRHGWYEPHPLQGVNVASALAQGLELRVGSTRFDLSAPKAPMPSHITTSWGLDIRGLDVLRRSVPPRSRA